LRNALRNSQELRQKDKNTLSTLSAPIVLFPNGIFLS